MAALVIHTPPDLDQAEVDRAAECGPALVASDAPMDVLLGSGGFRDIRSYELTDAFAATCEELLRIRDVREAELRAAEGDDAFEEEREKKKALLEGIRRGLLRRTLYVATVGPRPD